MYVVEMESISRLCYLCLQVQYALPAIILTGILVVIGTSLLCNVLYFDRPRNTRITVAAYTKHAPRCPAGAACLYRNSLRVHTIRHGKCRSWKPADFREFVTVSHDDIILLFFA